ncbi:hypothetical protein PV417_03920 [Streptomyces sp. ME19-03-3]|nr:hypothetical protein [Streptomyces sp. ME19-03-3]
MPSLVVGLTLIAFGVCLVIDFAGVAGHIHNFYASFMNPGRATPNTIRLVGVFVILVEAGWVDIVPVG